MIARTSLGRGLAVALSLALSHIAAPAAWAAPSHLVDSKDFSARLQERAAARAASVKLVEDALARPEAGQQATAMGVDIQKVRAAVPHLSDRELEDLSRRASQVNDVAAGHHHNDGLVILAIVLLIVAVAVIVAAEDGHSYDDCYCY